MALDENEFKLLDWKSIRDPQMRFVLEQLSTKLLTLVQRVNDELDTKADA